MKDFYPEEFRRELLDLLIKSSRRCAYDLRHAADGIYDNNLRDLFHKRADMWLDIFNPVDGIKDYRSNLHKEISDLEIKVSLFKKLCKENNINYNHIAEDIPF